MLLFATPLAVLCHFNSAKAADTVSSRALKSALILRLVDFVAWPPDTRPAPFPVCIVANEPLAEAVRQSVRKSPAGRAGVEVRHYANLKTAGCRLLYVGEYDERLLGAYLAAHREEPVLTIGESDAFLAAGGVLRIRIEDGRVKIDLQMAAASAAKLQISSRLARLANIVDREPSGGLK